MGWAFFFFFLGRVKYGFDSGWGFFHAGLGYFYFIWVRPKSGYSIGWGVDIQISRQRI